MNPQPARARALAMLLTAVLVLVAGGCSLTTRRAPAPPAPVVPRGGPVPAPPSNLDAIPDAVPRSEPRARLGNPPFYDVAGHRYVLLPSAEDYVERGVASWYGPDFHGIATSTGEPYDMYGMTAAHKTLPLPCYVRVTNLRNGRSIVVRVNDRGPFVGNRIIDLSYTAAAKLDMIRDGTALVEVRTVGPGSAPTGPPASSGPAGPVQPASASGTLYVQAGAFAEELNARRLVERLRAAGLAGVEIAPAAGAARRLYRVRIGPVADVPEFDRLVARLAEFGIANVRLALD